jgi:diguanylate cyclase (GGDEF)-like protein/PAS domain S-box-containing protein
VETAVTDSLDDPAVGGIVLNVRDVTARVEAEQALREERERYRSVVENVGEAVFEIDADGRWSFLNDGWRQLTGLEPEDTVGTEVVGLVHDDDRVALLDVVRAVAAGAMTVVEHQARFTLPQGERWLEARGRAVAQPRGRMGIAGILADVTERRQADERLADLALHDPLTRLANRTLLLDRLGHALARAGRTGVPLGVLFVDLDHFKEVNDTFGHAVGDELLVSVGDRLRRSLRETETIARYGGDEFVVVSEGVADEGAVQAVAERVRAALAEPFTIQGRPYTIGASVGVAVAYPGTAGGPELVIQQADLAMYRAKGRS